MLSSPSLQETAKQLESRGIYEITSPSLQDFWIAVFDHVPFVKADYVSHIPGVDFCIVASNLGFVLSNTVDSLFDPFGIGGHLSSSGAASVFF